MSQYGVTWIFDGEHQVGQFVTGDWWVVDPVTIAAVSPEPEDGRHGSTPSAAAIRALDGTAAWDHEPLFASVDRWVAGDIEGGGSASNAFVSQMWSLYRDAPPAVARCR